MYVPTIRNQIMGVTQQIPGEGARTSPLKSAETHGGAIGFSHEGLTGLKSRIRKD
jgi:hypothetical protein